MLENDGAVGAGGPQGKLPGVAKWRPRSALDAPAATGDDRRVRLSQKAQYAICGVFDLAYNGAEGPVQVRVIGERQRIPARYLEQIFQGLRRAELVHGKRGPGGGYVLARDPAEISLRDIIEAVEGPLSESIGAGPPPHDRRDATRPGFVWHELARSLGDALGAITVESMCRRAAAGAVDRAGADDRIWHI